MSSALHNANALGCELAGEMVRTFGRVRVRVTGTSMIPAVWPGDVLVVERRAGGKDSARGNCSSGAQPEDWWRIG